MPDSLNKSTEVMRKEMLDTRFDFGEEACGHEVEEIYNFYVINEGVDKFRKEAVKFPLLSPDEAINLILVFLVYLILIYRMAVDLFQVLNFPYKIYQVC